MTYPTSNEVIDVTGAPVAYHSSTIFGVPALNTTIQSFFLENTSGYLYIAQPWVEGDSDNSGDLCVSRMPTTGSSAFTITSSMYLTGFGHAVSFAVEYNSSANTSYLWIESNASSAGYGQNISRFHFDPTNHGSKSTALASSAVTLMRPVPDITASSFSVCLRQSTNVLVVRFLNDSTAMDGFQAYALSDATANDYASPLLPAPVYEPSSVQSADFQGWTFQGEFLYTLDGQSLNITPSKNTYTTSIDLLGTHNTANGYISRALHDKTDSSANPREPEGMSFDTRGSNYELIFGLSNSSGSTRGLDLWALNTTITYPS